MAVTLHKKWTCLSLPSWLLTFTDETVEGRKGGWILPPPPPPTYSLGNCAEAGCLSPIVWEQ